MGVMDHAVEHGVGVGGVANRRVSLIDGKLAGDDGGAVLEDLQEIVTGRGVERLEPPVVEDEEIDAADRAQEAGVAAGATGQSEIGALSRDALIEHGTVVAAGLIAERRGEPALADIGWSAGSAGWCGGRSSRLRLALPEGCGPEKASFRSHLFGADGIGEFTISLKGSFCVYV